MASSEVRTGGCGPLAADRHECRVLVVDDNVDSAQSMGLLLSLEGYQVECAYDGEQALDQAQAFRPDVVLLDLGLPRLSGFEVARRLRGRNGLAGQPGAPMLLVAVSGYGREEDRRAACEAGFDLHMTKPADPEEVLRMLARRCVPGYPACCDPGIVPPEFDAPKSIPNGPG